jgi:hypothetical protein
MTLEKQPDDRPRREKENMDEPQEEFIDISSIPSHPKHSTSKSDNSISTDAAKAVARRNTGEVQSGEK